MKRRIFIITILILLFTLPAQAQEVKALTIPVPAAKVGVSMEIPALPEDCGVQLIEYTWDDPGDVFEDRDYTLTLTLETCEDVVFHKALSLDLEEGYTLSSLRLSDTRCVAVYRVRPEPEKAASAALPMLMPGQSVAEVIGDFIFECPDRKTVLFLVYEDDVLLGYGGGDGVFSTDAKVQAGHTYRFLGTVTLNSGYVERVRIPNPQEAVSLSTMGGYRSFSLQAELLCPMAAREPFSDVHLSDWYYPGVDYCYRTGRMNGMGEGLFLPGGLCTRAQFATILYRAMGSPAPEGTASFTDVETDRWYTDAVLWAAEQGIVNGFPDGSFAPNRVLTRAQLAVMLYRLKGEETEGDLSDFSDADSVQDWAKEAMVWAVEHDILKGIDGALAPNAPATRAQCATIFMRMKE